MDKKEIMGSMPSSNRGRKKLANSLRAETFNVAYPNEGKTNASTQSEATPQPEIKEPVIEESTKKKENPSPMTEEKKLPMRPKQLLLKKRHLLQLRQRRKFLSQ